jgi:hypothetical protein
MSKDAKPPTATERLTVPLVMSFTLGLAPFVPEPHILGKLRWVAGGAVGMSLMDWFDLLMHGAPWAWLVSTLVQLGMERLRKDTPPKG